MLISFDIGIKNLAYCVFNKTCVVDWGIINLSDNATSVSAPVCNCLMKNGTPCNKKASYVHASSNIYCCTTHAKSSNKLMPSKDMCMPYVKKLKLDDLRLYCAQKFISISVDDKKPTILEKVQYYIDKNVLLPVKKTVVKTANQIHLVDIGRRIKNNFDTRFGPYINNITQVILENQISPIAGRMNTIQGMVAQYFIMKSLNVSIDFISSAGKLKGLSASSEYRDHKKDGIAFCHQFMTANPEMASKKSVIDEASKKDDLADCFLQGIYFMKKQNIINYSEDLKIKSVV